MKNSLKRSGRKPDRRRVRRHVFLDRDILARLEAVADDQRRPLGQQIEFALDQWLREHTNPNGELVK